MSNFNLYSKWTAIGWHDYYTTGGGFGTVALTGIDILKQDTRTHTESGTAQIFSGIAGAEWEWLVQDIYYVNSSLVQFYENDTLLTTHDDPASFPVSESIPIKFMVRTYDFPAGRHYHNSIRSNDNLNKIGTGLRMLTRQDWDGLVDDDAIRVWVDWVFIHEVNETDSVVSVGSEMTNINENKPTLTNGIVLPTIGHQNTNFTFEVNYTDIDDNAPDFVDVIINGTAYSMAKLNQSDTNYTSGVIYTYSTYLIPAKYNYTYMFDCSDGTFSNSTYSYYNLQVFETNLYSPYLVNPQVSPNIGGYGTLFNFTVWYYDDDNNLPTHINITISQTTFLMQKAYLLDTISTDGILYYFNTTLDFGYYQFRINCSDGKYVNSTNWFFGPEVNPFLNINAVTLLTPVDNDEIHANLTNFSWTSVDAVFSGINFTFQLSASNDFSTLLYEVTDINEMPNITYFPLNVNLPSGLFYWRVKPTYGEYSGDWSNYFQLNLLRNSFSPQLISYTVSALTGNQKTIFKFTVIYKDLDNNRPVFVKIIINGIQFFMEKTDPNDNDYTDGCMYQFLSLFAPSLEAYRYSFEWSDGIFTNATLTFNGPLVTSYIQEYDKTEGLNNRNSENIFIMIMSSAVGFCIVIPSILVTEVKVKHIKSNSNLKPKFKSKLKKLKKPKK